MGLVDLMNQSQFSLANNDVGQYSCYVASMFKKLPWNKQECMDSYENDGDAKVLLCIVRSSKATKVEWNDVNAIFKDKLTNVELVEGLLFVEQRLFIPGSYCELASQLLHTDHSPFHAMYGKYLVNFIGVGLVTRLRKLYDTCELCISLRRNK